MMEEFLMKNALSITSGGIMIVAVVVTIRVTIKNLVRDVSEMRSRMDERDGQHDHAIAELDKRLVAAETKIINMTGWLKEMRDQLNAIYRTVVK